MDQNQEEEPPTAMEDGDNSIDDVEDDGENEEEVEEEEEDTVDEDEFMFREGTNPLDFLHDNDSGVQMCQKLLDYNALPNKKRKAPEQSHREGTSSKKAREDDISGVCPADMIEIMNFEQTRSKKRGRQKGSKKKLDEKLSQMLGDANLHYANRRYDMVHYSVI
ncbi:general transcription factor 3C polypeptide [Trifolium pratense]|uniref:General transcription factor 3C polypeptide n=1 Tax=Trifolium pratense TaxID=57577 RepID=A0A2K3LIL6_TRIPR|nr:general transcription factor 3C polypeptide [Trifolium pratense]